MLLYQSGDTSATTGGEQESLKTRWKGVQMNFQNTLNALSEGIVIVNRQGKILFFNKAYERFINCPLSEAKGKDLSSLRPGALMPKKIEAGETVTCTLRKEDQQEYFASIYPIYEEGEITGGISIVTFLDKAEYFSKTMESLKQKESYLKKRMTSTNGTHYTFDDIIFGSEISAKCIESAKRIAHTDASVLLQGESGCGKEVFAQSIHNESSRCEYPFIAVNCAALNKDILESELFGYVSGAFTGAKKEGKVGLFEAAEHGTIFLDEISEMDLELQAKLLRTLQERKIRRLGSTKEIDIDVRVISACNVNLLKYIEENRFRMDLYYRLAVLPLQILPLRDRKEDLKPLVTAHLKKVSIQKKQIIAISDETMDILYQYDWPGNVRELYNVLEYAALLCQSSQIEPSDLPATVLKTDSSFSQELTLAERVKQFERQEICKLLDVFGHTVEGKKKAAKQLGISLASLYNKLQG